MNHCQCRLRKLNREMTYWIPEYFAKKGKILRLKGDDGWEVIEVGKPTDYKEVNDRSQDYKNQRKASDI